MNIEIKNCNNIDIGNIELIEGRLNIKYAINGTGKSTISKALEAYIKNDDSQKQALLPFKYYETTSTNTPEIYGAEKFNSVAIFNEKYVEDYIFQPNELIKNSFEIFIKTSDYENHTNEIEELLKNINLTFREHPELDELIEAFQNFVAGFGKAKSGYSAAGSIAKGIGKGNKIDNIPKGLEEYSTYLKNENNVKWIKWQMDGKSYLDMDDKCPYCANKVEEVRKKTILQVSEEYDAKSVEQLNKMLEVFELLNPYFSDEAESKIKEITQNAADITDAQKNYLIEVKKQVETFLTQLNGLKGIGFHSLKYSEKIADDLNKSRVDLSYYSHLNSKLSMEKVNVINSTLDEVLLKAGQLQGEINKQKKHIKETIEEYNTEINNFLYYAGYKYRVSIEYDNVNNYHLVLKHVDNKSNISSVTNHLSYGEKNAFALVLFMYEVLKINPDLVILDDPISSFDGNKKFAIINMLFMGKKCLKDRTVLLLTHEFNTVIDSIKNMCHHFNPSPKAAFLSTKEGVLTEKSISKKDIKSFVDIAKSSISSEIDILNKLVYLRRLQEIQEENTLSYQLVSNIFHKRKKPLYKYFDESSGEQKYREMINDEIIEAEKDVKKLIPEFNYEVEIEKTQNKRTIKELYINSGSNYEKMQLYRIAFNENHDNDVIRKFINETFHVENDYLFQLDPREYDTIPQYIIDECDEEMLKIN